MFIFPDKNQRFVKNESLQKYINDSIEKSIQQKIKTTVYFKKSPVKCDLHYLNCDFFWCKEWDKEELIKNCLLTKVFLNKKCLVTKDYLKNDFLVPFYFYFISTTSFFLWDYLFQGNSYNK